MPTMAHYIVWVHGKITAPEDAKWQFPVCSRIYNFNVVKLLLLSIFHTDLQISHSKQKALPE